MSARWYAVQVASLLLALAVGCSASTHVGNSANAPDRVAHADVDALVRRHPFYALVRHYDDQIATLRATHVADASRSALLERDARRLQASIDGTARSLDAIASANSGAYATEMQATVQRLLQARPASAVPNIDTISRSIAQRDAAQRAAFAESAREDFSAFGSRLSQQQSAALSAFARGLDARVARAYAAREQQLRDQEGAYALDLARRDGSQRVALEVRLRTLRLDALKRKSLQAQLQSIDAREAAEVAQSRARDAAQLAAFRARLVTQARADLRDAAARVRERGDVDLARREDVYRGQRTAAQSALGINSSLQRNAFGVPVQQRLREWRTPNVAAGAARDVRAAGGNALAHLLRVRTSDSAAARSVAGEVQTLRQERDALLARIRTQVETMGRAIAARKGERFIDGSAVGDDLTAQVDREIQAYAI